MSKVSWTHANCFTLPRKVTSDEFFAMLEASDDVTEAQLSEFRTVLSEGGTLSGKRGSGASESGINKRGKFDPTTDLSERE